MLASKPLAGEVAAWELNAQANALYVVRSLSSSQYQLFEDKTYGWTNRLDQSQNGGTALNVLDLSLQQIADGCRPTVSFAGISGLKSALGDAYAAVFSKEKTNDQAVADLEKAVAELMEDYN